MIIKPKTYYFFLFVIVLFSACNVSAQQDAHYTQYMYNTSVVNPAYAGSREAISAFVLHRNQWVGLEGAPITNAFSVHLPVGESHFSSGISFVSDRIGITDQNNIAADLVYSINASAKSKLSFGLKFSANLLNINYNKLEIKHPSDVVIAEQSNVSNQFSPNIGVGLYWYDDQNYVGISVPNLLENQYFDSEIKAATFKKSHYYFIAGSVFEWSSELKFKPTILTKIAQGAPMQIDVSGNFMWQDKFVVGVAYRWEAAWSGMVGMQINQSWFAGYAYDFDDSKLTRYNSGSHEIFLRFEIFQQPSKIISPRFF